jgi:uncharacterized OB-fold protein
MKDSDEHARRFKEAAHQMATSKIDIWNCLNCGKENRRDRQRCWKCGANQDGTSPENSDQGGSVTHLTGDPRATGETTSTVSASASKISKPVSEDVEVKALTIRYWDAYVVARVTAGLGEVIKVIAGVLAALIALGALLIAGQVGGGGAVITFFLGVIGAAFVGGQFYLLGVIVMAQGQILKASLDGAVNSSPFLQNEHRAKIMSLK